MTYGFILISAAWLFLAWRFWKKGERGLAPWFLRLYVLGALLVLLDTFRNISNLQSIFSAINVVVPVYILWKSGRR
jgi:hypothetical protein